MVASLEELASSGGDLDALRALAHDKSASNELTTALKELGVSKLGDRVKLGHLLRAERPRATVSAVAENSTGLDVSGDGGVIKRIIRNCE